MPTDSFSTLAPQHIQTVARRQARTWTCRSQALPPVRQVEALCCAPASLISTNASRPQPCCLRADVFRNDAF